MWTYVKAWTVVVALMCSLVTMVSVARGQQGGPDTQAFLVKDINAAFDTAAASSPARFVEVRGALLFSATYGTDGTPAGTTLVKGSASPSSATSTARSSSAPAIIHHSPHSNVARAVATASALAAWRTA